MQLIQPADHSLLDDREEFFPWLYSVCLCPERADHYSLINTGSLRAEVHFAGALTPTGNMIMYKVFDKVNEIKWGIHAFGLHVRMDTEQVS